MGFEPDENLEVQLIQEKEQTFLQRAPQEAVLVPGVRNWLSSAAARHIPQAIASSGPQENIDFLMSRFNLSLYFKALISGAELPAKPEPDVFLKAARVLNRTPEHCLVIEDAVPGVKAAKNAGMRCIAVATSTPKAALTDADLIVDDFTSPFKAMLNNFDIS